MYFAIGTINSHVQYFLAYKVESAWSIEEHCKRDFTVFYLLES